MRIEILGGSAAMMIGELPLLAQIGVAVAVAFLWFAATCFFGGVVIGAIQVVSYMRTPRHLRAERFPDLHKFEQPGTSNRRA
ncbi:hypothetical protein [Methylocystis suflitae]|uniref:hypothetical protein n=1 Tax=Methylocystis suflitae TaxID=2951405 RepID=UPI00210D0357|nr:hypothetical protein [Methylocystis suflitae]MCQ4189937.1 hypothetical protein [Methylocystis suflitae]